MMTTQRYPDNPVLVPDKVHGWEAEAVFNGSVVKHGGDYHLFYRAMSTRQFYSGMEMSLSTIGYSRGGDPTHFSNRTQLIVPEHDWERFGCEDPRVTKFGDKFYIFYTALSTWPPTPTGIKVAVAVTGQLGKIEEKHAVTTFNSKAMAVFPDKVNGKIAAILTAHTDMPPAKICVALFDDPAQMWDEGYWRQWYAKLDSHVVGLEKADSDQLEVGAAPIKTRDGWLIIYCHIQNYFGNPRIFRIDAALLDLDDPTKVLAQTIDPILIPETEYELYGMVPNVIFPSGAIVEKEQLLIYYGAADTTVCLASLPLPDLLEELAASRADKIGAGSHKEGLLTRFEGNPIISPIAQHAWESKATFNPAALALDDKVHILYRAMGDDNTSVVGYAQTSDGVHLTERLAEPVYIPRKAFEKKYKGGDSGCEDPRLTLLEQTLYMCYTAYDGKNPPRVALTSIKKDDFLTRNWDKWEMPTVVSPPGIDDKNAGLLPEKINGNFVIFHRINPNIWIDLVPDLKFGNNKWIGGHPLMTPRVNSWDSEKVGIAAPPIKTKEGWLLVYHGLSKFSRKYRLGAALLALDDPTKVLARLTYPILEPKEAYETNGPRPGTVFACGAVVLGEKLFVYYGGGDQVCAVSSVLLSELLAALKHE